MNAEAVNTIGQLTGEIKRLKDKIDDLEKSAMNHRLATEEKLKKSEKRYSDVISGLVWAIAIHVNNRIVYVNDALKDLVGISDEEKIIGRNVLEFVHPEDQKRVVKSIQSAFSNVSNNSNNTPNTIQERLIRSDGTVRIVEASAILMDYDGENALVVTLNDITERILAEKALRKSEAKYRLIADNTQDIISLHSFDLKFSLAYVSPSVKALSGYEPEELLGKSIFDFMHPNDKKGIIKELKLYIGYKLKKMLTGNNIPLSKTFEFRMKNKAGIWLFAQSTVSIVGNQIVSITRDISAAKKAEQALRQSEEKYRSIFEEALDGLIVVDQDSIIRKVNPTFSKITGIPEKEIVGKSGYDIAKKFIGIKQLPLLLDAIKNMLLNKPIKSFEISYEGKFFELSTNKQENGEYIGIIHDITERKQTEKSLLESEERYDLAIQATNEGIYDWNLISNEIYYSPTYKNLLGYKDEELPNDFKVWESLTAAEDVEKSWRMLDELINKKRPSFELEFKMKHKNGHWVDIQSRANAFFNQEGKAIRVVGTHVDITERKKQQQAIENSEYYLRKSQEIAKLGSYTLDIKKGVWESSPILDEIFGIEKQDEKNFEGWEKVLHPDDREMMMQYFTTDVLSNHQAFNKEYRIQRKNDKQERWVHGLGKLEFDEDGVLIVMHGTIQDITARKQSEKALKESEQKYRDLADLLPLIVYEIDTSGKLVYLNNKGFKTFGYTEEELEGGLNVLERIVPEDREQAKNSIQNRLQTLESGGVEYTAQKKDGTRFPVLIHSSVILLENKAVGLRGVIIDYTQRKEAEEALKKSEQQYRDFFEKDISGSFLSTPEGKLINCNPAFSKMLGYTPAEILEIDTVQFYPHASSRKEFIDRLTVDKNLLNLEIDLIRKDGQLINCVENVVGSFNSKGELIQFQGYIVDVTDRKIAENALRESEEKYRSLFATANDAIFVMKNDIFIACNQKTLEIFGCTEDEIIGYSPIMYSPEYQSDGMISQEKAAVKIKDALSGDPQFFEWTHQRKNGTPFYAEVSLKRMLLSDGEYIHAIVRNIDERKSAERALKKNEARLSTLISNLPGMTYLGIDDEHWTMLYLNGACEKLTGYRPEQIINNKEISFHEIIHPEDRQYVRDRIDPKIKIGKHFELEYRIITAKGETKWVWERGIHRASRDGKVMLTEGVIDDTTERVLAKHKLIESEEKYHGMIMNLMEGFYSATVDGKLTEYNTEFIKILGLDPGSNYLGLELPDFWEDRSQRKKYIREFYKNGFVKNYIVDIKRSDGTLAVVQINSRLIKYDSGEISRTEGTLLDITDRIQAEESLKQSENQLRNLTTYMDLKTENEKKIIAGEIHDGLGQLLTGLKMDLQWINKKHPKESAVLKHKLTSMNNIIDSAVTDIQNLSIQLRPKMLDDLGLLETLQSETDHFEERTGISCTIHFSPETFEVEHNRSSAIYRIMMELLTNVFRHAKATEVQIKLEKKINKCIFSVIDNGNGISLKQINSKSSYGLMSITERVKVWNGYVKIRGENNKGTTVEVTIPN